MFDKPACIISSVQIIIAITAFLAEQTLWSHG
jgi:hypothetical protein